VNFSGSRHVIALSVVLMAQTAAYYGAELRHENLPPVRPLSDFPTVVQNWTTVQETQVEQEVLDVLKADDTLSRVYANPAQNTAASLFIAYFKTQRTGQAPHSPKNCLPGSGWEPSDTGRLTVEIPGGAHPPIQINRYVVARGEEKSVVLYWYQSHSRVIASEFEAKFWLVADSIRYHRSDTTLVRVVVPVRGGELDPALNSAVSFVQALFPELQKQIPQ
jgi:EpsI family protein